MFYIFFIWLKGVGYKENRVQLGPPPAFSTRIYDTMSGIRVQVTQVASLLSPPCNCLFDILQGGEILIIDGVTTILNLMTAFGLLAVASLVRHFHRNSLALTPKH